jgi:hypothetical protein
MLLTPVLNPRKESYGSAMIRQLNELCSNVAIHIPEIISRNVTVRTRFERSVGSAKIIVGQRTVAHDAIPKITASKPSFQESSLTGQFDDVRRVVFVGQTGKIMAPFGLSLTQQPP